MLIKMTAFVHFILALIFLPFSLTAPLLPREWDHVPTIAPSHDPWYKDEPANLSGYSPGETIAYRAVAIPSYFNTSFSPNRVAQAWQVKYRTTDSRYNPTWAITTLYVPTQRDNDAVLLSYQQPYDSSNINRSPSYLAVTVDPSKDTTYAFALPWILNTNPGWFINMPDYEGPKASFSSGAISGQATLDSIRAVRQLSRQTGMSASIPFVMWGYSGGALATEWAAELQGSYAPGLTDLAVCALVGGLTPNLTNVFYTITEKNTSSAFIIPDAIEGLSTQFPELKQPVVSVLGRSSWGDVLAYVRGLVAAQDLGGLKSFIDRLLSVDDVKRVLSNDAVMGMHGVPLMDMYVYEASYDQVSPVQDTRKLVDRYCGLRGKVHYEEFTNPAVDHVGMGGRGLFYGLDLLDKVLKGRKLQECVKLTNAS